MNKFIVVFYLIVLSPRMVYAYIDPGSITILIQVLIVAIGGGIIAFRRNVANVFRWIFRIKRNKYPEK